MSSYILGLQDILREVAIEANTPKDINRSKKMKKQTKRNKIVDMRLKPLTMHIQRDVSSSKYVKSCGF